MPKQHDMNDVARAMLLKMAQCAGRAALRKKLSAAERRRLLRLRTVKALRDGNW